MCAVQFGIEAAQGADLSNMPGWAPQFPSAAQLQQDAAARTQSEDNQQFLDQLLQSAADLTNNSRPSGA